MKTLELKHLATEPQLYVSWGDHPQAFWPVLKTEPCIPCCTIL